MKKKKERIEIESIKSEKKVQISQKPPKPGTNVLRRRLAEFEFDLFRPADPCFVYGSLGARAGAA